MHAPSAIVWEPTEGLALPIHEGPRPGGLLPPQLSTSLGHPREAWAPSHSIPIRSWFPGLFESACGVRGRHGQRGPAWGAAHKGALRCSEPTDRMSSAQ